MAATITADCEAGTAEAAANTTTPFKQRMDHMHAEHHSHLGGGAPPRPAPPTTPLTRGRGLAVGRRTHSATRLHETHGGPLSTFDTGERSRIVPLRGRRARRWQIMSAHQVAARTEAHP